MNDAQKKGVGMLIATVIFTVPAIVATFGVAIPAWIPIVAQVVTMAAGIFGITVNLPANTNKN